MNGCLVFPTPGPGIRARTGGGGLWDVGFGDEQAHDANPRLTRSAHSASPPCKCLVLLRGGVDNLGVVRRDFLDLSLRVELLDSGTSERSCALQSLRDGGSRDQLHLRHLVMETLVGLLVEHDHRVKLLSNLSLRPFLFKIESIGDKV